MSQVVRLTEPALVHQRRAEPSWRINTRSIMLGRSLRDGCRPLERLDKLPWTWTGSYQGCPSSLQQVSEQTRAEAEEAAVKSIHMRRDECRGNSLRFNVGWQWADISLTVTECWNHFLLGVRECEAWSISPWRPVVIRASHTCIYPIKRGSIQSGVRDFFSDVNNVFRTVHK